MAHPSVAIIGAGPAGLVLANRLSLAGQSVQVLERDSGPTARDQGGTLDLHPEDGQLALDRIGLLGEFLAIARHGDQEQRAYDFGNGRLLHAEIPEHGQGDRPEIDRVALRELLLGGLPAGTVRWGARAEGVTALPDGRFDVRGSEGSLGIFDLVVGADGAWSVVREALSDRRPFYTGVTFVELWFADVDRRHPEISRLVGRGTMFAMATGGGLIAQRNGNATLRVYAAFNTTAEEGTRTDQTLAGIDKAGVVRRLPGCDPSLLRLVLDADSIAAVRPIVALPLPMDWAHRTGLTLIGDAAHVMPPLGVGVNLAMLDAVQLGDALVSSSDWRDAVRAFEGAMQRRVAPVARECLAGFAEWFAADGADRLVEHLTRVR